jgi:hypothetical protein
MQNKFKGKPNFKKTPSSPSHFNPFLKQKKKEEALRQTNTKNKGFKAQRKCPFCCAKP